MHDYTRPIEILMVEDNLGDIRLTQEAMKECRVKNRLHVVKDGVSALAFLRQQGEFVASPKPDLVLLDLNLPKKSGHEVLEEIKGDEGLKRIPVAVLTTSKAEEDIHKSYGLHANCYITKPVDLDQFLQVVQAIDHFWLSIVTLSTVQS